MRIREVEAAMVTLVQSRKGLEKKRAIQALRVFRETHGLVLGKRLDVQSKWDKQRTIHPVYRNRKLDSLYIQVNDKHDRVGREIQGKLKGIRTREEIIEVRNYVR